MVEFSVTDAKFGYDHCSDSSALFEHSSVSSLDSKVMNNGNNLKRNIIGMHQGNKSCRLEYHSKYE